MFGFYVLLNSGVIRLVGLLVPYTKILRWNLAELRWGPQSTTKRGPCSSPFVEQGVS